MNEFDQFKTEVLEGIRFGVTQEFGTEMFHEVELISNFFQDTVIASLRTQLLGKRLPTRNYEVRGSFSIPIPSSTWQMFKQQHRGSWWLRWLVERRPVEVREQYKSVWVTMDITDIVVYPWQTLVPTDRKLGHPVRVVTPGTPRWDWTPEGEL